jgi:uncharacterized protein
MTAQTKTVLGMRPSAWIRVAPFVVFMVVLALRGLASEQGAGAGAGPGPGAGAGLGFDARWLYAAQVLLPAAVLACWWRHYGELARQTWPTLREAAMAMAIGVLVFVLWIHLDAPWMQLSLGAGSSAPSFVPLNAAGQLHWPLIVTRCLGAALLVPVMEELFWRSFLMRWVQSPVFEAVSPNSVGLRAVIVSTFVFVLAHTLWLAAAIAGLAYALLYMRSGKLWCAVIAHAVTNGALGIWVVTTGQWQFW